MARRKEGTGLRCSTTSLRGRQSRKSLSTKRLPIMANLLNGNKCGRVNCRAVYRGRNERRHELALNNREIHPPCSDLLCSAQFVYRDSTGWGSEFQKQRTRPS